MPLIFTLSVLAGGLVNRFRGGWLPTGHTQLTRGIYSAVLALLVLVATHDTLAAAVTLPLWFLGALSPHGAWMRITDALDVLFGSTCGVLTVAPAAAALWYFGHAWLPLLALGLAQGPAYWLGWRSPTIAPSFEKGTGLGEFFFGLAMGLGIALSGL